MQEQQQRPRGVNKSKNSRSTDDILDNDNIHTTIQTDNNDGGKMTVAEQSFPADFLDRSKAYNVLDGYLRPKHGPSLLQLANAYSAVLWDVNGNTVLMKIIITIVAQNETPLHSHAYCAMHQAKHTVVCQPWHPD
jgi:hypothetical protein